MDFSKLDFKKILMKGAGIAAGVVAGAQANKMLTDAFAKGTNTAGADKKKSLIMLAGGLLVPELFGKQIKGNALIENAFDGVAAEGIKQAILAFAPEQAVTLGIAGNYDANLGRSYDDNLGEPIYLGAGLEADELMQDPETGMMYQMIDGEMVPASVGDAYEEIYED